MLIVEKEYDTKNLEGITRNKTVPTHREGASDDLMIIDAVTKQPVLLQVNLTELKPQMRELARQLRFLKIKWSDPVGKLTKSERLSGIGSNNITFGHTAPNAMYKRHAARIAPIHLESPATANLLTSLIVPAWQQFQKHLPDIATQHQQKTVQEIHQDWLLEKTPFTSGICNHTSVLPYHKDAGNLLDAWSMMLCSRKDVDGGGLHIPEYDTTLAIPDCSLTIFCGQKLLHGVTPLVYKKKGAYRFTIVYYTKQALSKCGAAADETLRAQKRATAITERQISRNAD
jgi:hypothetical protein